MVAVQQIPDTVIIRHAEASDRRAILQVNRLAWQAAYTHIYTLQEIDALFENSIRQYGSWTLQRDQRLVTLVAEYHGQVIGFIGVGTLINDKSGEVTTFYIHPDYQNQGIGKSLWQYGLEVLANAGCPAAWVWVLEKAPARQFYRAMGCVEQAYGSYTVGTHREPAIGYHAYIPHIQQKLSDSR